MIVASAAAAAAPADPDLLSYELTRLLTNGMGGPMPEKERQEFLIGIADDMRDIPAALALEAVRQARKNCTRAAEVLPFITRYVEDYPYRIRRRLQRLLTLAEVAGVRID